MGRPLLLFLAALSGGSQAHTLIPEIKPGDSCIQLYDRNYEADERIVALALSDAESNNEALQFFNASPPSDGSAVFYVFAIARADDSWRIYEVSASTGAITGKFYYSEWTYRRHCKPRPGPNDSFKPMPLRGSA